MTTTIARTNTFIAALLLVSFACTGPVENNASDTPVDASTSDGFLGPDGAEADLEPPLDIIFDKPAPQDVPFDFPGREIPADLPWSPEPGEPGYPCETSGDCNYGFCIQTGNGLQCTQTCEDECPFDWSCVLHTPSAPDQIFICVPSLVDLCKPCQQNTDCWVGGIDAGEACVSYGPSGNYCGGACQEDGDCPTGYSCQTGEDVTGAPVDQCLTDSSECTCKQWYIDAGATTACYAVNDWGTCPGERICKAAGLTQCSAAVPAVETCNGVDDDCDDTVDEETAGSECFVTNQFGSCPGFDDCVDGKLVCVGEEAHPESCDGEDDDCDGEVDEGYEDTDGDGVADCLESDIDGDDVPDVQDNCPADYNPGQEDFDSDNFGDPCDKDDDNDKTPDLEDCAPKDDSVHPDAEETCDGKDNNCNYIVDEGFADTDFDGWKNCVDEDDDNDGHNDGLDCNPTDPLIHPEASELCDDKDNDCDLLTDEGFSNLDNDAQADCVDSDDDGDDVPDGVDNCPKIANPDQEDADDDTVGDLCDSDFDGDGIPDSIDNCIGLANASQANVDNDGFGDACDEDQDNDGEPNGTDNCPLVANQDQSDLDQDGTGDACEDDKDGDGIADNLDCMPEDGSIHQGAQEVCDGIDNNCNLAVDEGYPDGDFDGKADCVDGDDDNDGDLDETDCADLNPAVHALAQEICDGIDNNCNNEIDEDLSKITCGKGVCNHAVPACENGVVNTCDPFEGISEEVCDGVDNDCNGLTDEGLGTLTCGLGVCTHTVPACLNGQPKECNPQEGAEAEICDGSDNDCDGKTDEEMPTLACGKGACFHTVESCVGGIIKECNAFEGALQEVCDGIDNDCDGDQDEDLGLVTCGKGNCEHQEQYCVEGKVAGCDPFAGVAIEICDGEDNDCNGLVDESIWPITCGKGACLHTVPGCDNGQPGLCDPQDGATDETCDGADNDCDGLVDEGLGSTTCGIGQCQHTVVNCINGEPQVCDPLQGSSPETCDGIDNDCNNDTDPEDSFGCAEYFLDTDEDGYGLTADHKCLCAPSGQYAAVVGDDCNDELETFNPGLADDCSTLDDENCDNVINDSCVYDDCGDALASLPAATSGTYVVDPDGEGGEDSFEVFCDMETDGGGWTLLMTTSSASAFLYDHAVWTDATGGSEAAGDPTADVDYVSKAFYTLESTESRMAMGATNHWNSWTHTQDTARDLVNRPRMSGSYGAAATCPARTNCGTEPVNKRPLGLQEATSSSTSNKWNRFGYVNDLNGWGTGTRIGFTGDNDGSDSSDSIMGIGVKCWSSCLGGSCTGAPHDTGTGFYLYTSWATTPLDGATQGWLWIR
jgi:hypothetical protein